MTVSCSMVMVAGGELGCVCLARKESTCAWETQFLPVKWRITAKRVVLLVIRVV